MQLEKLGLNLDLSCLDLYNIHSELRVAHFISQCDHESNGFTQAIENLNYSATALISIFPKYFPNFSDSNDYARNPEKIANKIYANRIGNSDEKSGDGWKYRGRGFIQLTGKSNQTLFLNSVGSVEPEDISEKYPLESACWFWQANRLNEFADIGGVEQVAAITKKINGGNLGLQKRIELFNKYYELLTS